jgi:proteasome accessory factor B
MATPKVERLVNLTIALLEARRPLTFAEIRRRTRFYDQSDQQSARRMFERDKDDLRRLGVPVEVRTDPFDDEPGYLVPRTAYELPDVDLTADEVAALALAVAMTGGEGARLAWARLAARAPDPVDTGGQPRVRVTVRVDPVEAIADAVVRRRRLVFTYRNARGSVADRDVEPYAVVQRRGAWYLVGRDRDRGAVRTFRLARIVGEPHAVGEDAAFTHPDGLDLAASVEPPAGEAVDLDLAVRPAARWAVESRGGVTTGEEEDGWLRMHLTQVDPVREHAWLLGLAADVVVRAPSHVRDALRRDLVAAHDAQDAVG